MTLGSTVSTVTADGTTVRGTGMVLRSRPGAAESRTTAHAVARAARISASVIAMVCLVLPLTVPAVRAETLQQALTSAYRTNPGLDAERARLRATDEEGPKARAGWKPTVTGRAEYGRVSVTTQPNTSSSANVNQSGYGVTFVQPLFTGFRTLNAVNEAEARIRAGRERLRRVESEVLLAAATAYADVVRDIALVNLAKRNANVLAQELRAAETRRKVGEVTLTDVAQARARHAKALSSLDQATANLRGSRANYRRVVGNVPGPLRPTRSLGRLLPRSMAEAVRTALGENPLVGAALYEEQAARFAVDKVWGELLPQVRLEATYDHTDNVTDQIRSQDSARIMGRVTVPLYQGGETRARVRQAKHLHVSRIQEIEKARTDVRADATSAWSQLVAARARLQSDMVQVNAARTALTGVRTEEKVGQRSLLDVLNAEQELVEAESAVTRTRRDIVVAEFNVLAALGRLDARFLSLPIEHYDPEVHYREAKGKWFTVAITSPGLRGRAEPDTAPEPVSGPNIEERSHRTAPLRGLSRPPLAPRPEPVDDRAPPPHARWLCAVATNILHWRSWAGETWLPRPST